MLPETETLLFWTNPPRRVFRQDFTDAHAVTIPAHVHDFDCARDHPVVQVFSPGRYGPALNPLACLAWHTPGPNDLTVTFPLLMWDPVTYAFDEHPVALQSGTVLISGYQREKAS
jgi:hypothetical protein